MILTGDIHTGRVSSAEIVGAPGHDLRARRLARLAGHALSAAVGPQAVRAARPPDHQQARVDDHRPPPADPTVDNNVGLIKIAPGRNGRYRFTLQLWRVRPFIGVAQRLFGRKARQGRPADPRPTRTRAPLRRTRCCGTPRATKTTTRRGLDRPLSRQGQRGVLRRRDRVAERRRRLRPRRAGADRPRRQLRPAGRRAAARAEHPALGPPAEPVVARVHPRRHRRQPARGRAALARRRIPGARRQRDHRGHAASTTTSPTVDPNVALLAVRTTPEEAAAVVARATEQPNLERLRYDLFETLGFWQAFMWTRGTAEPARAGRPDGRLVARRVLLRGDPTRPHARRQRPQQRARAPVERRALVGRGVRRVRPPDPRALRAPRPALQGARAGSEH